MSIAPLVLRTLLTHLRSWLESQEYVPDPLVGFGPAAAHEGGHATLAHVFGMLIRLVRIGPDDGVGSVEVDVPTTLKMESRIDFQLAGIVAEARVLSGAKAPWLPWTFHRFEAKRDQEDLDIAWGHAWELAQGDQMHANQLLEEAFQRAMQRLATDDVWRAVSNVAEALHVHRCLDGDDVHWLIKSGLEGRTYDTLNVKLADRIKRRAKKKAAARRGP